MAWNGEIRATREDRRGMAKEASGRTDAMVPEAASPGPLRRLRFAYNAQMIRRATATATATATAPLPRR
ncbi:hypothetical protein GCM10023144_15740 [Pigmentiphaga soli]|uniref:Uncharacterized protein n=1 Tax=Pigmentiphaga soli TaxID=1007095 RepID=A0ABP8GS87_9BURK